MAITNYATLKVAVNNWLNRSDLTPRVTEFIALGEDRLSRDLLDRGGVRAMENRINVIAKATVSAGDAGGTANALTLTPTTAATSYALGDSYSFTAAATNTDTATVDISSLGTKNIKVREGNGTRGLVANEIVNGIEYHIYYDGTQFLMTPQGAIPLPDRYLGMRHVHLPGVAKRLDFFPGTQFWTRKATNESGRPKIYTIEGDFIVLAPKTDTTTSVAIVYWRRLPALSSDTDQNWFLAYATGPLLYASLMEAMPWLAGDPRAQILPTLYAESLDAIMRADRHDRFPAGELTLRPDVHVV